MGSFIKGSLVVAGIAAGLVAGLILASGPRQAAWAEQKGTGQEGGAPHYSVVVTDGLHLVVTDNKTGTTYFYSIDEDEKPGADLKLRGTVDLKQVGKPVIKPVLINPRKKKAE